MASPIWATASIGMAVGSGYVYLSLLGTVLVLFILSSLTYLQTYIDNHHKIREYRISVSKAEDIGYCENKFKEHHLKYLTVGQQYTQGSLTTRWSLTGGNKNHEALMKSLINDPKITAYQF